MVLDLKSMKNCQKLAIMGFIASFYQNYLLKKKITKYYRLELIKIN